MAKNQISTEDGFIKFYTYGGKKLNYKENFLLSWIHSFDEFKVTNKTIDSATKMKERSVCAVLKSLVEFKLIDRYGIKPRRCKSLVSFAKNEKFLKINKSLFKLNLNLSEILTLSVYESLSETPSINSISKKTLLNRKSVRSSIESLTEKGYIDSETYNNDSILEDEMVSVAVMNEKIEKYKIEYNKVFNSHNNLRKKEIERLKEEIATLKDCAIEFPVEALLSGMG